MSYWILKTEPSTYSYDQLERDGNAAWDGVANPVAIKNLKEMVKGDEVLIYHTGAEKSVIGTAMVTGPAYPDPKGRDPRMVVVDLKVGRRLPAPVTLAVIKADPVFKDIALVRQGRLSVVPATAAHWRRLFELAKA